MLLVIGVALLVIAATMLFSKQFTAESLQFLAAVYAFAGLISLFMWVLIRL